MTPYLLITVVSLLAALLVATRADGAGPSLKTRTAEKIVATWNCQDKIPQKRTWAYSPWKPHSQAFRRWQLNLWTLRLKKCRAVLARRAYEWNWQAWLPAHAARLAVCETSMDWHFVGSSTDGHFVSAFAISVNVYNRDAARMGVRGWWDTPYPPSPWEQWQAAIGHYRLFGDGWTGRCHGIMHA
jgi:hypothetical protein